MKIYSDVFDRSDIANALPRGVILEELEKIENPRVRSRGWKVRLGRPASRRHFNTGNYGAGDFGAASWDDHGVWMAALFAIDPAARLARWDGVSDFTVGTDGKFSEVASVVA